MPKPLVVPYCNGWTLLHHSKEEHTLLGVRIEEACLANLGSVGNIPIIVLEVGRFEQSSSELDQAVLAEHQDLVHSLQTELTALSSLGQLISVQDSGHFIQIEEPAVVINSILQVVQSVQ